MSYPHTVTLITPSANQSIANRIARAFDTDSGGQFTFKVGCSSDGNLPITHYIANTWAQQSFVDQINGVKAGTLSLKALVDAAYSARWQEETPPTQEECDEFWDSAVIEIDKDWREVLTDNELQLIATDST